MEISNESKEIINSNYNNDGNEFIWNEFLDTVRMLDKLDNKIVKEYLLNNFKEDAKIIEEEYYKAFKDVPDNSKLKIETLLLLSKLGIVIYKQDDNNDDDDKWEERLSPTDD